MLKWVPFYTCPTANSPATGSQSIPHERWGHASVVVDQLLYIIGGYDGDYCGDIWTFSFKTHKFTEIEYTNQNPFLIPYKRSNHTACYHAKTQSIYLFGGAILEERYNDINVFHIPTNTLKLQDVYDEMIPTPRTYHGGQIIGDFMIIMGGESSLGDLDDVWVFDIEKKKWFRPSMEGALPLRRFFSCSAIARGIFLFGGCVGDYVYFDDLYLINCDSLINRKEKKLYCYHIEGMIGDIPHARWGHTSATFRGKLYVFGGRSRDDYNDLHVFSPFKRKWKRLCCGGALPAARRRTSACFAGSAFVIFGGYNGKFLNDAYFIDILREDKIKVSKSSLPIDLAGVCGDFTYSDAKICLGDQVINVNRGLLLHLCSKSEFNKSDFLKSVAKEGVGSIPSDICEISTLKGLLEFLYSGNIVNAISLVDLKKMPGLAERLGLNDVKTALSLIAKKAEDHIKSLILKSSERSLRKFEMVTETEKCSKLCFIDAEFLASKSPEDSFRKAFLKPSRPCYQIDDFYDVVFATEGSYIKANRCLITKRCPYFSVLFSTPLAERSLKTINLPKIPRVYLSLILQFIYTDKVTLPPLSKDYEKPFLLLIQADYFMLPRLVDICSEYISQLIDMHTATRIMLFAYVYNAQRLLNLTAYYIAYHADLMFPIIYGDLRKQCSASIYEYLHTTMLKHCDLKYVSMYHGQYLKKIKKCAKQKIDIEKLEKFIDSLIPESYRWSEEDAVIFYKDFKSARKFRPKTYEEEIAEMSDPKNSAEEVKVQPIPVFCIAEWLESDTKNTGKNSAVNTENGNSTHYMNDRDVSKFSIEDSLETNQDKPVKEN